MTTLSHAANLLTSRRLQTLRDALSDGTWHSCWSLQQKTGSMAVHSEIAELRANGLDVRQRYSGRTPSGRRISEYRIPLSQGAFF